MKESARDTNDKEDNGVMHIGNPQALWRGCLQVVRFSLRNDTAWGPEWHKSIIAILRAVHQKRQPIKPVSILQISHNIVHVLSPKFILFQWLTKLISLIHVFHRSATLKRS